MLRILIVALVLLVAAILWRPQPAAPPSVATLLPQTLALPAVQLVDQTGAPFTLDALRGDFTLLFFGFTRCPDVCPLTLKVLADARAAIGTRTQGDMPKVLFVSVDPARDTPALIEAYLRNFDPAFIGVTAADAELQPLLKALGVTVEKHDHGGGAYNVVHNSTVYVLGPQTELIAVSSGPHVAATLADDYLKIRQSYQARRRPAPKA